MAVSGVELQQGTNLQEALSRWVMGLTRNDIEDERYQSLFFDLDKAMAETIGYMQDRKKGGRSSVKRERVLTDLWLQAGRSASSISPELADNCYMKGLGWTDPQAWEDARQLGHQIGIPAMQAVRKKLNDQRHRLASEKVPFWFPIAGAFFAFLTFAFLAYLLIAGPPFDHTKRQIFIVLVAFSVSASAAFLGGSAAAQGKIPFFADSPISFSAAGGIGIFIVIYLLLNNAFPSPTPIILPAPKPGPPRSRLKSARARFVQTAGGLTIAGSPARWI